MRSSCHFKSFSTSERLNGVVVIHEGFGRDLATLLNVDKQRIREIRNWTHDPRPAPSASAAFRSRHGWDPMK